MTRRDRARSEAMGVGGRREWRGGRRCYHLLFCILYGLRQGDGFQPSTLGCFRAREPASHWRSRQRESQPAVIKAAADSAGGGDIEWDQDGTDLMSELMGEVNKRESLRRKEEVRLVKRPSALLPPHAVLEHVLGSLRTPDFPTDGVGLQQAFLFSALDHEVSRGPVDYRRDWSDEEERQPRYLDKESYAAVLRNVLGFLVGLSEFSVTGAPIFSEDDHRVIFPVRVIPDQHTSALRWVEVDFRLGRVRDGSHKDCWLVEKAIVRSWGGAPGVQPF